MPYRFLQLFILFSLALAALVLLMACSKEEQPQEDSTLPLIISTTEGFTAVSPSQEETSSVSGSDLDAYIILDDEKTTINGSGVSFENGKIRINFAGTYYFTGNLTDGQIYININEPDKKVKLVFAGVRINCSTDAPVYIENSPKETVIILEKGTENFLEDTARAVASDVTDYATAVIYSKDDLQIEGEGKLNVTGNFNKGIFSKNDIAVRGGTICVNAVDDALRGKDGIEISGGELQLVCGGDAIRTSELTDTTKGDILISGGRLTAESGLDGIQATGSILIEGGELMIKCAGGSTGKTASDNRFGGQQMFTSFKGTPAEDSSAYEAGSDAEKSAKAVKAGRTLTVNAGNFIIDSVDDAFHSPVISINGGSYYIMSDDDGFHADESITVSGGEIQLSRCYEGIEGRIINISGGSVSLNSSDDGFNAAAKNQSTSAEAFAKPQERRGGMGGMDYDESCLITMSGGYVYINAQGDGVDSNGSVNMTGGTMIVYGPTGGGNGTLDYGGQFTVSGGTLLAAGTNEMAQSVTASGSVRAISLNTYCREDTIAAITSSGGETLVAFRNPKSYSLIIFASDKLEENEAYSFYTGGSVKNTENAKNGICFDGVYVPGNLVGALY